ncbi:hypothetical protein NQ317_000813 [Molorchus minor]|uniref:Endonuclease/exonuclease/phosphatase domain-containing protein n=1 Tax=Molorchus minor TaxID=1323400 RepID=A0ABQ9IWS4_9CUCU|nr:hypothetical protein NQ317_000813 [Molorchus minor]
MKALSSRAGVYLDAVDCIFVPAKLDLFRSNLVAHKSGHTPCPLLIHNFSTKHTHTHKTLYTFRTEQKNIRGQPGQTPGNKMAGGPSMQEDESPSTLEMLAEQLRDARIQNERLNDTIEELKTMMANQQVQQQQQRAIDQENMEFLRRELANMRAERDAARAAAHPHPQPKTADPSAEKSATAENSAEVKTKSRRKNAKRTKLDSPTSSSESDQPSPPQRLRQKKESPCDPAKQGSLDLALQDTPREEGSVHQSQAGDVRNDGSTVREAPVDSIRILSWNADGIRSKKNELLEIADRLDPDVIAIQETKMDSRHEFRMRGYKVYRQDRNIRGGGVAVLVKSNITHHQTRAGGLGNLEAIGVEIQLPRREPLHILSCYQPPNSPLLGEDLGDLFPDALQVIAIGDFNAKSPQWNSRRLNARGRELEGFLDAHPEIRPIGPPEPTQQSANKISDVLDIALAGNIPYDLSIANHREGSSDHDPILLTVWDTHTNITTHTRKITDWGAFRAHLQTHIHDITLIHNTEELDLAVLNLETDIKTSLVHSTTERQEPRREKCLGQISEEAMDLIRARRAAKRRAWRTRDPADRRVYNQYTRLVREELDSLRQERWNSYLSELDPADPGLWKTQKILRTARRPIPPIHGERGLVYTKQDKAEAFADSLEMQCRENPIDEDLEEWERTEMLQRNPRQ